jgi:hypothetical protein
MLLLISDVSPHILQNRLADRNGKILVLPRELRPAQALLVNPERGLALYQLHDLFNPLVCAERDQAMNVVNVAADEIKINALRFSVLLDVLENLLPNFAVEVRLAILS